MTNTNDRYFISRTQYNCPFCETKAVKYIVLGTHRFHWDKESWRKCVRIQCQEPECERISIHMTKYDVKENPYNRAMDLPVSEETGEEWNESEIDDLFFYQHPNSTFSVDPRIPKKIREAMEEAASAQKLGHKIGSSAALRKAIFEILAHQKIPKTKTIEGKMKKIRYQERFDLLEKKVKKENPNVDADLVRGMKKIYSLVSQTLHEKLPEEQEWEDFTAPQFNFLLETVHSLIIGLFIIPVENEHRKNTLNKMSKKVSGFK